MQAIAILAATVFWQAPLEQGAVAFDVLRSGGAEGVVEFVRTNGVAALHVVKTNDKGRFIVVPKQPFAVPKGADVRLRIKSEVFTRDPEFAHGHLAFRDHRGFYVEDKVAEGHALRGRQSMGYLRNTAPGRPHERFSYWPSARVESTGAVPAIVISGKPSDTLWYDWVADDYGESKRDRADAWGDSRRAKDYQSTMCPERAFDEFLAADRDHVAQLKKVDGVTRLTVDGQVVAPMLFKGMHHSRAVMRFAGAPMESAGLTLQVGNVMLGGTRKTPGYWTTNGFDAVGAADRIRCEMRTATNSLFVLSVSINPPPEYSERHPEELWRIRNGTVVTGDVGLASIEVKRGYEHRERWPWVSNHSLVWREDVKRNLTALIDELKRTGATKRIVGFHLAGFHDGQFATAYPDYSEPAQKAYARWREERGLDPARLPDFGTAPFFDPVADADRIEAMKFLKRAPFAMQEDVMRHAKRCLGKPSLGFRWCMSAFGGAFFSSYDITPFVHSDAIDVIVPQADYMRRLPGFALGGRPVCASFNLHGKLLVHELDLRTYAVRKPEVSESADYGASRALDAEMWRAIHRKTTGQMLARDEGWWYYEMSGGWFDDKDILADIRAVKGVAARLAHRHPSAWRPSVAYAVDEDSLFLQNITDRGVKPAVDLNSIIGEQVHLLAGSSVPFDQYLLDDFVRDPSLASKYRLLVIAGKFLPRKELMAELSRRTTVVSLERTEDQLTPGAFNALARKARAYVPTREGLQVDMNGDFLSVHCIVPGHYDFKLPKGKLPLDLSAGEVRWFDLSDGSRLF